MPDYKSFNSLTSAISLKGAIEQAEQRYFPQTTNRAPGGGGSVSGLQARQATKVPKPDDIPIFDDQGEPFGHELIPQKGYIPTAPPLTPVGTIVVYCKTPQTCIFGVSIEPPKQAVRHGVYVIPASREDIKQYAQSHPGAKQLTLTTEDLHKIDAEDRIYLQNLQKDHVNHHNFVDLVIYIIFAGIVLGLIVLIIIFF
jgi:hypothetical protein